MWRFSLKIGDQQLASELPISDVEASDMAAVFYMGHPDGRGDKISTIIRVGSIEVSLVKEE